MKIKQFDDILLDLEVLCVRINTFRILSIKCIDESSNSRSLSVPDIPLPEFNYDSPFNQI